MNKQSLAVVSVAALLSFGLTACGSSSSESTDDESTFIYANGVEPQNPLIPTNTNETGGGKIVDSLNAGLVYYTQDALPKLDLAESIEPNIDNTEWTIKIKPGKVFSDGTPINADSFIDTWNWGANAANKQQNSYFFELIKGYDAEKIVEKLDGLQKVDDLTFKVVLTSPTSDFNKRLGYSAYVPLPKVAFKDMKAYGENPTVTSGPYKLKDKGWMHNNSVTIVKNNKYDGPRKATNDGVVFKLYSKLDAAYADAQAGKMDVLDDIPSSALKLFKKDFNGRSSSEAVASVYSFTIDSEKQPHFQNGTKEGELRRQALAQAINRKEICETIFNNTKEPAHEFTSPSLKADFKDINSQLGNLTKNATYNPEEAKKKWAEADKISPFEGKIELAYNSDGGHQEWVDAVTNQIKNTLGIEAAGKPYPDFKSLRDEIGKRATNSAFRTGWQADYPGISNFLEPIFATNGSSNDGKFSNGEVDKLLREANATTNPKKQNAKYAEIERILLTEMPAIPLWYSTQNIVWSDKVTDVKVNWNGVVRYFEIKKK